MNSKKDCLIVESHNNKILSLPDGKFIYGTVALPDDEPGHEYGQWSARLSLQNSAVFLQVFSPEAPIKKIEKSTICFFCGSSFKAELFVVKYVENMDEELNKLKLKQALITWLGDYEDNSGTPLWVSIHRDPWLVDEIYNDIKET